MHKSKKNASIPQKDSQLITFGPFDIILTTVSLSFSIQAFDNRNSKVFLLELKNPEIADLTQNLCTSQQELAALLSAGFLNKKQNSEISISQTGLLAYQCKITFPIERIYCFEMQLKEQEITEIQKLDLQIKKVGSKLAFLQQNLKEKTKILLKETLYQGAFSMILNSGYYSFSNHYRSVKRNFNDVKSFKTVWGNKPFEKKGQQAFVVNIERINSDFDCLYGYIGVCYGLHHGLNIYNSKGAFCITNGKATIDGKEVIMNDFLFQGDFIKVIVDYDGEEIKWVRNGVTIFKIGLMGEDLKKYELFPVISLSNVGETVVLIQN